MPKHCLRIVWNEHFVIQTTKLIFAIEEAFFIAQLVAISENCILFLLTVTSFIKSSNSQFCYNKMLANIYLLPMQWSIISLKWSNPDFVHVPVSSNISPYEVKIQLMPTLFGSTTVSQLDWLSVRFDLLHRLSFSTSVISSSTSFTPTPIAFITDQCLLEEFFADYSATTDLIKSVVNFASLVSDFWVLAIIGNSFLYYNKNLTLEHRFVNFNA